MKTRPGKKVQRQHNLQERLNKRGNVRSQHDVQTRGVKKCNVLLGNIRNTVEFDSGDNRGEDVHDITLLTTKEKDGGKNNKKDKEDESANDLEVIETADFSKGGHYVSILPSMKLDIFTKIAERKFTTY